MSYTVQDTPSIVARIQRDLETVARRVQEADPHLRALVLTGGFARGEGAVFQGEPQNDYDFVAIRAARPGGSDYGRLEQELSQELGLHVDLARVAAWRLRRARPTIFWYETALRGRTLWGEELLGRIPVRTVEAIDAAEGLRLLVNRSAGLLLATGAIGDHARRIQSSKALLAALDARLLARGIFPPSQRERYETAQALPGGPAALGLDPGWLAWAYAFKVDPEHAPPMESWEAWKAARGAVLDALPLALHHAGLPSLERYARRDGLLDHLVFLWRSRGLRGRRGLLLNPTGKVRVATVRLLEACPDGRLPRDAVPRQLGDSPDPIGRLNALRRATLQ